ncbi:MAG: peptide deformylase [Candidatus Nitronauta litoralis]|uniref:Peptide deformylase n=1 Tax=Candidatus Nitronauta litoralis TaxID=2705533 RepID=A0A7T0BWH4_9BACT|nr:MAG: peptide deformylase [Candidatus Nitronauta litoralis]
MAQLEILTFPNERLKQVSQPVEVFDDDLRSFLKDLEETMDGGPSSVGIAAPQVGRFERIVLVDVSAKPKTPNHGRLFLINPKIVTEQGQVVGREGCLSVPDLTGNVSRAETIELEAQDGNGNPLNFKMEGFEARAVQHEMDHLDGLLFLDRLVSRRDLFRRKKYK